jgi:preprotein translocase subunit SecY
MSLLEGALVTLVLIWTVIFVVVLIIAVVVYRSLKRALDKANAILDETQAKAEEFDLPSKIVTASVIGFMAKQSVGPLMKLIGRQFSKKK